MKSDAENRRIEFDDDEESQRFMRRALTHEEPGALARGTRIQKLTWQPGDRTPLGEAGTIIACIGCERGELGYLVRWDAKPNEVAGILGRKIGPC